MRVKVQLSLWKTGLFCLSHERYEYMMHFVYLLLFVFVYVCECVCLCVSLRISSCLSVCARACVDFRFPPNKFWAH
jgi:hypothetical protein